MHNSNNKGWFSIIEIMIGIFVFSLGLTSIFAMLSGSISMSDYSRNLIIGSNLANEELELYKNIRDSNYAEWNLWNRIDPSAKYSDNINTAFQIGWYYIIENNYEDWANFPIKTLSLSSSVDEDIKSYEPSMDEYQLCLNENKQYVYCNWDSSLEKTVFYRYLRIEKAIYDDSSGNEKDLIDVWSEKEVAYKIISKVLWTGKKFGSTEISTIVTDWKKQ